MFDGLGSIFVDSGVPIWFVSDIIVVSLIFKLFTVKVGKDQLQREVNRLNDKIDEKVKYNDKQIESLKEQLKTLNNDFKMDFRSLQDNIKEILMLINQKR